MDKMDKFIVSVCTYCDNLYDCDNNWHEQKYINCMDEFEERGLELNCGSCKYFNEHPFIREGDKKNYCDLTNEVVEEYDYCRKHIFVEV